MKDAIDNHFLCPYNYYVHYSVLTPSELDKYYDISEKLSHIFVPEDKPDSAAKKKYDSLCRLRANVVKGSVNRLLVLKDIITEYDPILNPEVGPTYSKCIIYCNTTSESKEIYRLLNSMNLPVAEYHSNIENHNSRDDVLDCFCHSSYLRYIISIGCLDQGVDLPVCDGAIILSSTTNPRQYIQRRGRVLRTNSGKKKRAYIHDVVILPYSYDDVISEKKYMNNFDRKMIETQLNRIETFIESSDNDYVVDQDLSKIKRMCYL